MIDQTVATDGAEVYRAEPGSERNAGDQTNIFTRLQWSEIVVEVVTCSC